MSTTDRLIALLRERHDAGFNKYGVTVDRTDLTPEQWAQHAIEEMLDGAAYLMRLKDQIAGLQGRVKRLEEAGNNVAFRLSLWRLSEGKWLCEEDAEAWKAWHQAKEAKP